MVAILGANGSGKSTVVRAVFSLAQVLGGFVRVFGTERSRFTDWRRVGYVPQAHTIAGGMPTTVREVVSSGRLTHVAPWRRFNDDDRAAVARAIAAVGLADLARVPVARLSGGQQRRVVIARALAGEPDLLLLDEPTAGVDVANQEALADILAELRETGLTVVLIAHELGPVAPLVTRVVMLGNGIVTFDGPPEDAPVAAMGGDWHHEHARPAHPPRSVGFLGDG
jgi:zinc transport system ATP-binding protein